MNPVSVLKRIPPFAFLIRGLCFGIHHYPFIRPNFSEILIYSLFIKKGDTILDIGANVGEYTSLFSKLTGEGGEL